MAYLTKDMSGLIQLWNNKPELCNDIWCAWIDKTMSKNEIGIDVTCNEYFNSLFGNIPAPICISILRIITSKN